MKHFFNILDSDSKYYKQKKYLFKIDFGTGVLDERRRKRKTNRFF